MAFVGEVTRMASLLLVAVFATAVVHKGRVLRGGAAEREPLLAVSAARRRNASLYLAAAAIVELVLIAGLLLRPAAALPCAAGVLLGYAAELRRLRPDEDCGCLGNLARFDVRRAVIRNVVVAAGSLLIAVPAWVTEAPEARLTQANTGAGVVVVAVGSAWLLYARSFRRTAAAIPTGRAGST